MVTERPANRFALEQADVLAQARIGICIQFSVMPAFSRPHLSPAIIHAIRPDFDRPIRRTPACDRRPIAPGRVSAIVRGRIVRVPTRHYLLRQMPKTSRSTFAHVGLFKAGIDHRALHLRLCTSGHQPEQHDAQPRLPTTTGNGGTWIECDHEAMPRIKTRVPSHTHLVHRRNGGKCVSSDRSGSGTSPAARNRSRSGRR